MTENGEGDSDGMIPSESEVNLDDEGYRTLSGVHDVLDEHQSKSGSSRAPDPNSLAKYARKLKTRSGLPHVDEVSVCFASAFSWKLYSLHYYHIQAAQSNTSVSESITSSRRGQPTTHSETQKRGTLIYSFAVKQII